MIRGDEACFLSALKIMTQLVANAFADSTGSGA